MQHTYVQTCGILVVPVYLDFCKEMSFDWFGSTDDKVVTARLPSLLTEVATRALKRPISVHVEFAIQHVRSNYYWGYKPVWTAVARTATGGDALLLKQALDADTLQKRLEASLPLCDGALASDPACLTI